MRFNRSFRFLVDINRGLISVEFSRIPRLVESGKIFEYRVGVGRNLRLVGFSRFLRF